MQWNCSDEFSTTTLLDGPAVMRGYPKGGKRSSRLKEMLSLLSFQFEGGAAGLISLSVCFEKKCC